MNKIILALGAITIITASVAPALNLTEARDVNDGHSIISEQYRPVIEATTMCTKSLPGGTKKPSVSGTLTTSSDAGAGEASTDEAGSEVFGSLSADVVPAISTSSPATNDHISTSSDTSVIKPDNSSSKPEQREPTATQSETMTPTTSNSTTSSGMKWGVFPGSNLSDYLTFTQQVPENPDYIATFVHWPNHGGVHSSWLDEVVRDEDRTLVLFWEASDYVIGGTNQPDYSYRAIIRGDHDAYITRFAHHLRTYGGPVILIPFSEMNGDWSPWSGTLNGNTPDEMIAAYRHLHGFFNDVPNVSFGWAVNSRSYPNTPENSITKYYPGDEYVDYVGVDGFNFGNPWESFSTIFSDSLETLAQYNKPTFLFSFGSAPGPQKSAWLDDALNEQLPNYPHVTGMIYFNQDKERNWLLWSDQETLQVWRNYVRNLE